MGIILRITQYLNSATVMACCKIATLVEHRHPGIHRAIELPKMNVPAPKWTNWIPMHDDKSPKSFISKWVKSSSSQSLVGRSHSSGRKDVRHVSPTSQLIF
ncbi:hypothetical protein SeMB42_g07669 [Synchytrium endobioticum]|uniref:Uncharacterized protein n=1 Tax=Synchytrium endobioticum TaxID=286115 RepID=A0A507C347_9FUNG|nr:hypothetical protein SeMB42_g07669 [Synchytrium endobioticum]